MFRYEIRCLKMRRPRLLTSAMAEEQTPDSSHMGRKGARMWTRDVRG